ncbi:MAG TPA: hypothetical protein VFF39_19750 [Verrucomicrobiae bacterium]|jgi:hypothetical protein|nr:hypothetical protein [Verrucomicrobiae bacterium]
MTLTMQKARNPRFYAGLYMRTKKKVRFWGWGRPEFRGTPVTKVERPWAALADWLRAAHSLAGTDRQNTLSENTLRSTESSVDAPVVEQQSATPPALRPKRKLRFVCDRNFIGLAYR